MVDDVIIFVGVIAVFVFVLLFAFFHSGSSYDDSLELWDDNDDHVSGVSCDSDSMGLSVNCHDEFYSRYVDGVEPLRVGEIYLYHDGNDSIIHRLVFDLKNGSLIFKGDNNERAELVDRSMVYAKPLYMRFG